MADKLEEDAQKVDCGNSESRQNEYRGEVPDRPQCNIGSDGAQDERYGCDSDRIQQLLFPVHILGLLADHQRTNELEIKEDGEHGQQAKQ